ncbi:MAG: hypothetical protein JW809_06070 [Pirellulales bacterium]|nr:hypothetical protein [Pirellulales bacterium]
MDRRAMGALGIDGDMPITFKIAGVRLRSALELMLGEIDVTYLMRDEALMITMPEAVEDDLETRVYDVTDLVVIGDVSDPKGEDFGTLIEVVMATVWPESWLETHGGPGGIGRCVVGNVRALVITQTQPAHREVAQLLADLRKPSPLGTRGDPWQREAEQRIEAALDGPITIAAKETPLAKLVEELSQQHKVPIIIRRRTLEALGIDANAPITCEASEIHLRSALRWIVQDLELDYAVTNEAVLISSTDDLECWMSTRVYDVTDLVTFQDEQGRRWQDFDPLWDLITETLCPETWAEVHGGPGQIRGFSRSKVGMFVITQTYGIHRRIAELLARLRQVGPPVPPDGPFPVRPRPVKPYHVPGSKPLVGPLSHDDVAGKAHLKVTAEQLKKTVISPHTEEPIAPDKNVLWCNTLALAWNELCDLSGGPVQLVPDHPMVAILNKRAASKEDLDAASYVARAGLASDGIFEQIRRELEKKFSSQASPVLLDAMAQHELVDWFAYAYLFKNLPFECEFGRWADRLQFDGQPVEAFGLIPSSPDVSNNSIIAEQVSVLDYRSDDDFIVELHTKAKDDRLILAKVAPEGTLEDTIDAIRRRVERAEPKWLQPGDTLLVPVLNFDVMREYGELHMRNLKSDNSAISGPVLAMVQSIRFRLDERGAVLKSEAVVGGLGMAETVTLGPKPRNLIFDKPFLILLCRRGAKRPYFALWVGNIELLVASQPRRQ